MKSLKVLLLAVIILLSPAFVSAQLENYEWVTMWGSCGSGDYQFGVDLGPRGLVVDETENLYVADYGNQKIKVFSTLGTFKYSFYSSYVSDIDYANGYLYFTRPYGYVYKSTVTGTTVWSKYFSAPGWNLNGICVDSDGNIHVCNSYYNKVYKLDPSNGNLIKEYSVPEGCWQIASDNSGHVYIASGSGPVQRFTNDGVYDNSRLDLPPEERAGGIDVDNQGNIFIGTSNYKMRKYDPNWNLLAEWGEQGSGQGQFSGIQGVAVDGQGCVYVSDGGGGGTCTGFNRRIQVFKPAQPIQLSIVELLPMQAIQEIDGSDILVDINDNGVPDLVTNKLTAVLLKPSPIPGFTGVIEVSLTVKFGEEEVCQADNIQLEYEQGVLKYKPWTQDTPYGAYKNEVYIVLLFAPKNEGTFQFTTTLMDRHEVILQDQTWDQQWEIKKTKDLSISYFGIDDVPWDAYESTYEMNDDFIQAIFPLTLSYKGTLADYELHYDWNVVGSSGERGAAYLSYLWGKGKQLYPNADKIVGIVPKGWIKEKLNRDTDGFSWFATDAVIVEEKVKTVVAHEIGHTFDLPGAAYGNPPFVCMEEYHDNCERFSDDGYNPYTKCPETDEDAEPMEYLNFMNRDALNDGFGCEVGGVKPHPRGRWINHESYEYLWKQLRESDGDPEIVLVSGIISKQDSLALMNFLRLPEGSTSILIPSDYSISELDANKGILFKAAFSLQFGYPTDSAYIETDWAPFTLSIPYVQGATKFVISNGESAFVEIEPLSTLLENAINSHPDNGFVKNPQQRRKALINKVQAFYSMLSEGDTTAAKNKLVNDILKHVKDWLIEDYPIDSLAIPIQVSKAEIIELINAMIPKISWYASSGGNHKPSNPRGEVPKQFNLGQNYPNPFNPACEIKYDLPTDCQVTLCIYNILGQKVRVLVDEYQSAANKAVQWDGKDDQGKEVTSGIYFYRIQAGDFSQSKKMVLLR